MDPEVALRKARLAAARVIELVDADDGDTSHEAIEAAAEELAEAFGDLDNWMTHGGFSPASWANRALA